MSCSTGAASGAAGREGGGRERQTRRCFRRRGCWSRPPRSWKGDSVTTRGHSRRSERSCRSPAPVDREHRSRFDRKWCRKRLKRLSPRPEMAPPRRGRSFPPAHAAVRELGRNSSPRVQGENRPCELQILAPKPLKRLDRRRIRRSPQSPAGLLASSRNLK